MKRLIFILFALVLIFLNPFVILGFITRFIATSFVVGYDSLNKINPFLKWLMK